MKADPQKRRIVVLTRYNEQFASARVRYLQYAEKWKEAGWSVLVNILLKERFNRFILTKQKATFEFIIYVISSYIKRIFFVLFSIKKNDIVFIQLEILPMFPSILERYLKWRKIHFVIDFDDSFFDFYEKSDNKWVTIFLKDKFSNVVTMADWNITGSIYLTQYAHKRSMYVTEIPTSVLMEDYIHHSVQERNFFTIGWIGSPSTSKFLDDIGLVLLEFIKKYDCQLLLIGYEGSLLKTHPNIIHKPWEKQTEIDLLKQIHVGIMPLRNDGFSLGKCGFKLIQYMACGKSTISTPLPANVNIDGGTGNLFANNEQEWYQSLEKVYNQQTYFEKIGEANRDRVKANYSIEANYSKYLDIFAIL